MTAATAPAAVVAAASAAAAAAASATTTRPILGLTCIIGNYGNSAVKSAKKYGFL